MLHRKKKRVRLSFFNILMLYNTVFVCTVLFHATDFSVTADFSADLSADIPANVSNKPSKKYLKKFAKYKQSYNKHYNNDDDENRHYLTFVKNLKAAMALNKSTSAGSSTIYVMNKYADLNPAEVEERYGIHLKTYDAVEKDDYRAQLRSDHGVEINYHNLYNLKNADELFQRYIEDEKRNFNNNKDGFMHFYKFVKTMVEKNKGVYEGRDTPDLGHRADILAQSQEFFY